MADTINELLSKIENNEKRIDTNSKSLYEMEKTVNKFEDYSPKDFSKKIDCLSTHSKIDKMLDGCQNIIHDLDKRESVLEAQFKQFLLINTEDRKLMNENQTYLKKVIKQMMVQRQEVTMKLIGVIAASGVSIFGIGTLIVKYILGG